MSATPLYPFPHLHAAVAQPADPGRWRWQARGLLSDLRDELGVAIDGSTDLQACLAAVLHTVQSAISANEGAPSAPMAD